VYGALVGNHANITMCKLFDLNEELVGVFLVTACNELVTFTNIKTGEVKLKIYDEDALHGYVTCLKVSSDCLAVGYSSGTVIVYRLKLETAASTTEKASLEKLHQFSFHRSPVTALEFFNGNT
jgi:hypothetical protein